MLTLIVEDDFTSRILLQKFLAPYSETHIAVNGQEAINAYKNSFEQGGPYDLICLDIFIPEKDGLLVLHEIRAHENKKHQPPYKKVKIVMTTSMDDPKSVASAFHEYCDGYLIKPISRNKLINQLKVLKLISESE